MSNTSCLSRGLRRPALGLLWLGLLLANHCLAANLPPVITTQPVSRSIVVGSPVTFTVVVSSQSTLSYQWLKNGAKINGANASTYSIGGVQASDAATYTVKVTNAGGSVTSLGATLTILYPPAITSPPQSQTLAVGQNTSFSVAATGTAPLSYQWYFNATAISGATGSSYTVTNAQQAKAGNYVVVINNAAGTATSSSAALTVVNPVIGVDKTSSAVTQGTTLSWPHIGSNGNNRILVVGVAMHNSWHNVLSATYGGQNLALVGQSVDGGGKVKVVLYQLVAPPAGTNTVRVVIDSPDSLSGGAVSFTGVSQTAPLGAFGAAGGNSSSGSVSLASATNEVVADIMGATGDAITLTAGGNQVARWTNSTGSTSTDAIGASSTVIGTPTTTLSWTLGFPKHWALAAVALKPAPLLADVCTTQTGPTNVFAGASFSYTVTVTNQGPSIAGNVLVTNLLPPSVAFVSASAGGTLQGGGVTWPALASLPPGTCTNFTVTVTAPASGTLTSTVASCSATSDPSPSNNNGTATAATVVTVVAPLPPPRLSAACMVPTGFSFQLSVPAGRTYVVLASTNFRDWTPIATNVAPSDTFGFTDPAATNLTSRFYRAMVQ